jgi:hypothetical protein
MVGYVTALVERLIEKKTLIYKEDCRGIQEAGT